MIGKTSLRIVKLIRGNAQIHKNAVSTAYAEPFKYLVYLRVIPSHNSRRIACQPFSRSFHRLGISVYSHKPAALFAVKPFSDLSRMSCSSGSAVAVNAVRSNVQTLQALIKQYGNVVKFH